MTATLHDLLKSYREGGVFPSYDQLAAIAGQGQIGAAVRGEAVAEVLKEARAFIEANSGEVGYGFHRPANPHEFHPDAEMCSAEEIAAHKAACEAYDKGEFKQDSELGWIGPNVHVLTAPWGIGSYAYRSEEAEGMLAKIDAALSDRAADALDSQPTEPDRLPPLPEPIEVGGEGWGFDDFKSEKTFSCEHMWAYARAAIASSQPTDGGVRNGSDLEAVHAFLMGESALEGVQFSEKHPTKAGAFWWRLNLRAALAKG